MTDTQTTTAHENVIVMMMNTSIWQRLRRQGRPLLIAVLFIVLVISASAVWVWQRHVDERNSAAVVAITADNRQFNALQAITTKEESYEHYDQAASAWISYAATTPSKTHMADAFLNAAALYVSNTEYPKAATMCQDAESVNGVTFGGAEVCASTYMSLGNKPEAIHYYQAAIRLAPMSLSDRSMEIDFFKQAIQEMQANK